MNRRPQDSTRLEELEKLMAAERWEDAIAAAGEVLEDEPSNDQVLWIAGWARVRLDRHEEAIDYLKRAIDAGPVKASSYWSIAVPLMELGQYESAELWLLRALAVKDLTIARSHLALVYMKLDLDDLAEAVHKEGIRLKPDDGKRMESYAAFLSDVGRETEALEMEEKVQAPPKKSGLET